MTDLEGAESPFSHPPLARGYPLDRKERDAVDRLLARYERARAAEERRVAEQGQAEKRSA